MPKVKKQKRRLPREIIPLPNKDKDFHEKWTQGRDWLNFPHPWRGVFLGPPGSGKSTTLKNIILRAKPHFEQIVIVHCDSEFTKEYEDLDAVMLSEIPQPHEWPGDRKCLVVLEDLNFKEMSKDQKKALDRLYGYVSTHKNISVGLCAQDPFNVPPCVRRCSNVFCIWRGPDLISAASVAQRAGQSPANLKKLFDSFTSPRESVWLDLSEHSPAPVRVNGYTKVEFQN